MSFHTYLSDHFYNICPAFTNPNLRGNRNDWADTAGHDEIGYLLSEIFSAALKHPDKQVKVHILMSFIGQFFVTHESHFAFSNPILRHKPPNVNVSNTISMPRPRRFNFHYYIYINQLNNVSFLSYMQVSFKIL